MATNDYFSQFLSENSSERNILEEKLNALKESSPILDLVEQKREELGLKVEQKKAEFINKTIDIEDVIDADTLFDLGRLGAEKGFTFDQLLNLTLPFSVLLNLI